MNKGVREALRCLNHAIDHAEDAAANTAEMNIYGTLWTDMVNAVARCASALEHKKAAPGAENTESGKANKSISSLSESAEKVKAARPLDLHTEMFMLNMAAETLHSHYVDDLATSLILSDLIRKCMEADEA